MHNGHSQRCTHTLSASGRGLYARQSMPTPVPACTVCGLCGVPQASRYHIPIYITETGIADRSDANRAHMIDSYMQAVRGRAGRRAGPISAWTPACKRAGQWGRPDHSLRRSGRMKMQPSLPAASRCHHSLLTASQPPLLLRCRRCVP